MVVEIETPTRFIIGMIVGFETCCQNALLGLIQIIYYNANMIEAASRGVGAGIAARRFRVRIQRQVRVVFSDVNRVPSHGRIALPAYMPAEKLTQKAGRQLRVTDCDIDVLKGRSTHEFLLS